MKILMNQVRNQQVYRFELMVAWFQYLRTNHLDHRITRIVIRRIQIFCLVVESIVLIKRDICFIKFIECVRFITDMLINKIVRVI